MESVTADGKADAGVKEKAVFHAATFGFVNFVVGQIGFIPLMILCCPCDTSQCLLILGRQRCVFVGKNEIVVAQLSMGMSARASDRTP